MNKKMRFLIVHSLCAVVTFAPSSVWAQTVELQDGVTSLLSVADSHNATLRSLQSAIKESEAGIESARMAKLPDISGEVSVSYLGNGRTWDRHFGDAAAAPMPHYGNNFVLRAQQIIYGGGAILSSIELSQQAARMASLSAEEGRKKVHFALISLYLQLHSLLNQQTVYSTNASLAQALIEQMKKRREQGVSLRNDVTRYELQLQQMLLGISTMQDQQSIVQHELLTALGSDSIAIKMLSEEAFSEDAIAALSEDYWQQLAAEQNVGLQKSALSIDMSQTRERMERSEMLPKVAVVAEDDLTGPITIEVPAINRNFNYWYVGLGVTYNFSSLYKNRRKVRQAKLATATARDEHVAAKQGVSDAVHAAYVSLGTARTQLSTQLKSVQLASENYDVVSKRYQNGLALVTDLTDASNMKLDAELALANARINLVFSYYNLRYVAGAL